MICQLILRNADIRTQDPARPRARALALGGGRILALGDDQQVLDLAGRHTRVLDLGGRLVLPGFTDSHIHYLDWSLSLEQLPLHRCRSRKELLELVRERAEQARPGRWLVGRGFDESTWPRPVYPTRGELDQAGGGRPVLLYRRDMHLALANSAALEAAGIGPHTPDPPEGVIDREDSGRPSGVLRETAIHLAGEAVPPPDQEHILQAMDRAQDHLHRLGVTGVHDMRIMGGVCARPSATAWQELLERGRLRLRCWMALPGEHLEQIAALGLRSGFGGELLRLGHLKLFSDGSLGARTAWMLEPFRDSGGRGMPLVKPPRLARLIARAQEAGLAVAVHSIGDRALRELIGVFQSLPRARGIPHRIEHVQMLRPEDLERLAGLGVTASVQPLHLVDDMAMMDQAVGPGAENAYRFRQMLEAGIPLCFGSDSPVSHPNPLWGIQAAVLRRDRRGRPAGGWYPGQCITLEQAVGAYTTAPARATGREAELGSLAPGKLADLVALERDIFSIPPQEITSTRVDLTVFQGRIVHLRPGCGLEEPAGADQAGAGTRPWT